MKTNQEPMDKTTQPELKELDIVTIVDAKNGIYEVESENGVVTLYSSKWLQQERDKCLKFKGKAKREWYQKGYSDALKEHKQT